MAVRLTVATLTAHRPPSTAECPLTPAPTPASRRLELPVPARLVVLISGTGTLLQALLDAGAEFPAHVVAVGADREAEGLRRAKVPSFVVKLTDHPDRASWDAALTDAVGRHQPDLVVLAGFMKLLGPVFLARFGGRVINSHPALLPAFPGPRAVADALRYGAKVTGCSIILVDAGVDTGPVLAQQPVPIEPADDEQTLHERIKIVERRLLIDVVAALARHGATITGREVSIP